jgi:hypothetical protein
LVPPNQKIFVLGEKHVTASVPEQYYYDLISSVTDRAIIIEERMDCDMSRFENSPLPKVGVEDDLLSAFQMLITTP